MAQDTTVHFKRLICVYVPERRSERAGRDAARVVITPSGNELIMSHFAEADGAAAAPVASPQDPQPTLQPVAAAG
jgi:hypothetical protein